jgi:hypothetical protein
MKPATRLFGLFDGAIDRVLCVVGAVLFSQGPEFMQQYLQRLGGHLQEARNHVASFQNAATQAGQTLDQFIAQTSANPDASVGRLGTVMSDLLHRVTALQTSHDAIQDASLWSRPFVFLRHLDLQVARGTWSVYKPAVPTTLEGLAYALTGMVTFLAIYHLLAKPALRRIGTRPPAKPAAA